MTIFIYEHDAFILFHYTLVSDNVKDCGDVEMVPTQVRASSNAQTAAIGLIGKRAAGNLHMI